MNTREHFSPYPPLNHAHRQLRPPHRGRGIQRPIFSRPQGVGLQKPRGSLPNVSNEGPRQRFPVRGRGIYPRPSSSIHGPRFPSTGRRPNTTGTIVDAVSEEHADTTTGYAANDAYSTQTGYDPLDKSRMNSKFGVEKGFSNNGQMPGLNPCGRGFKGSEEGRLIEDTIETVEEEDSDEEEENFCKYCKIQLADNTAYNKHIRGMQHTQNVMEHKSKKTPRYQNVQASGFSSALSGKLETQASAPDPVENNKLEFYCKVCDIKCTGRVTFKMHVTGARHKGNVESRKDAGENNIDIGGLVESRVMDTGRKAKLTDVIKKYDLPIIGLQFVTEIQKEDPSADCNYICNLCDSKCYGKSVINHISGHKHRVQYLKCCHQDKFSEISALSTIKKKSELSALSEKFAREIEAREGRGHVKVKLEIEPVIGTTDVKKLQEMDFHSSKSTPAKKPRLSDGGLYVQKEVTEQSDNYKGHNYGGYESSHYSNRGNQDGYYGNEDCYEDPSHNAPFYGGNKGKSSSIGDYQGEGSQYQAVENQDNTYIQNEDAELYQEFLQWKKERKGGNGANTGSHSTSKSSDPGGKGENQNISEILLSLSSSMITTEEEAAMALQVSTTLTQALLQYRLKKIPKEIQSGSQLSHI